MKAFFYILVLVLLTLGSCTSSLYTGAEYDDLYYSGSDKTVVKNRQAVADKIKSEDYYDNIYAADTLVSDQYSDAVNYDNANIDNNNNYGSGYDYDSNYPYSGRLRRFYGNYFDPYWRDPFYYDFGYPSFGYSFGYGGFPYSYNPYFSSPYYGYGGLYGEYLGNYYNGGLYPGYYGGYYGGFGYSSFYNPYGNYFGSYIRNEEKNSLPYSRRERPSTLSSKWNSNANATGSSRREPNLSAAGNSGIARRIPSGTQTIAADQRRPYSNNANSQVVGNATDRRLNQTQSAVENINAEATTRRSPANIRPEYNSTNRSYTPSYSNPRMSTRPSYNNSRATDGVNDRNNSEVSNSRSYNSTGAGRVPSNQGSYQNPGNNARSNSSVNSVQRRSFTPSNNSVQYSAPTRRSTESSSGFSSGSYNNSSSGSRSSSSFSSGSSGSSSGGSYSSGSSSSGSSSGSSSRRR